MDRQLSLKAILLLSTLAFPGCASSPLRPFRWWRGQTNSQPLAQRTNTESMDDGTGRVASEALTAAPPRLPAGVELPPTPTQPYASQPSTASVPGAPEVIGAVIPAAFPQGADRPLPSPTIAK